MIRGPKPKPTRIKLLQGNPGRRPLPSHEPHPHGPMPEPPPILGEVALAEWHRLAPELYRLGILTLADRAIFAAYCRAYERWCWAEAQLKNIEACIVTAPRSGLTLPAVYLGMANTALKLMHGAAVELGLTPSSRTRVGQGTLPEEDALATFLTPRTR